jgi:hypothetical protein
MPLRYGAFEIINEQVSDNSFKLNRIVSLGHKVDSS